MRFKSKRPVRETYCEPDWQSCNMVEIFTRYNLVAYGRKRRGLPNRRKIEKERYETGRSSKVLQ